MAAEGSEFADGFCSCWIIDSAAALHKALEDLVMLLEVLASLKLRVNLNKTALLLNIKGKAERLVPPTLALLLTVRNI